jgi:hypothetical protein
VQTFASFFLKRPTEFLLIAALDVEASLEQLEDMDILKIEFTKL